jgi:predicted cupin superfamily sugar epimerase
MITAEALIDHLGLIPLDIEGGWFRQTYVSADTLSKSHLPDRYRVDKPFSTLIYYLLTAAPESFSALHRLPTDEIYHFYLGDPVELLQLNSDGSSVVVRLGHDLFNGEVVQHVVPGGVWQGSRLIQGGAFALMGTTMAPGYTSEDYEGGTQDLLIEQYPDRADLITRLTR